MKRKLFLILLVALAPAACSDRDLTSAGRESALTDAPALRAATSAGHLTVLTRNMYVGAPVEPILAETDPDAIPIRVAEAWAVLMATDFPARARAMAQEITHLRPHLVALQEVTLLRTQTPSDIIFGVLQPNAVDTTFDFLSQLLDELSALGMQYRVASSVENFDIEVPRFDADGGAIPFTDVRLTDYEVILARHDVATANRASGNYAQTLPLPTGIEIARGWAAVDARVEGFTYRVVGTHLESDVQLVRLAQVSELLQLLVGETRPLVVLGDFNSGPGRPETQAYELMVGSGYLDLWTARVGEPGDGFTCCHAGDLSNTVPSLTQRIDLIFARNFAVTPGRAAARVDVIGDDTADLLRWGVWPSDHAGVIAAIVRPNAPDLP